MSLSLSAFLTKPMKIEVYLLSLHAQKIFNFLLGESKQPLNISIQNSKGEEVKVIKPNNEIYRFTENMLLGEGGYILYMLDEYWRYHSDKEIYEFSVTEIHFDNKSFLFIVQLSILIAVAQISGIDHLNDTHGLFKETKEDRVKIKDLLNLRVNSNTYSINESLKLFYSKMLLS
ncbi:MAG: hypothetical protein J6578_10180 [Snodgrassella sp.]|uniref:hypothetical protein n=1 Tax=Snodgrassella sp. TaxID=2815304 RepID=UPI002590E027|nr:hypothetical protein [Snodgrassella sp.]MCO6509134.1 hypothetical protein [Snodgrassella sp.]MCO6555562.1 hypothetical protein [Gilliamella sp.]